MLFIESGFSPHLCQKFCNLRKLKTCDKEVETKSYCICLIIVDDKISIFILIKAEKFRQKEDASAETVLNRPVHDFTLVS